MPILYIDPEHEQVVEHPTAGLVHQAKVQEARDRIAAAAGEPCLVTRFDEVCPSQVDQVAPDALVIGGCTTDWAAYDLATLNGLLETIRAAPVPILGICAGHQLIGLAHGAPWGPLGELDEGERDPDPRFAPGLRKERGFLPVQLDARCPLFQGLPATATFFQSHYWQLERVPPGFIGRAGSRCSPIQAMERLDRPVFGAQFHLERYDAEHPDGATVLRNFFRLVRQSVSPAHLRHLT